MDSAALSELEERIEGRVLSQLRAVPVAPGRPLLVVDADEVLVEFAAHLKRFAATLGIDMHLARYALEGAFRERATGRVLAFDDAIGLIHRFFAEETHAQSAVPGAAASLARLSAVAQVVVLTNVPRHAREARIENLRALGIDYPLVENGGGKGRPLAWLAARARAAAAFVDDSPEQIASAARHASSVTRVHFAGAAYVADIIPDCAEAQHRVASWGEAEPVLRRALG